MFQMWFSMRVAAVVVVFLAAAATATYPPPAPAYQPPPVYKPPPCYPETKYVTHYQTQVQQVSRGRHTFNL